MSLEGVAVLAFLVGLAAGCSLMRFIVHTQIDTLRQRVELWRDQSEHYATIADYYRNRQNGNQHRPS